MGAGSGQADDNVGAGKRAAIADRCRPATNRSRSRACCTTRIH
jgi:hypothetical protein